jgi:uncharacterized protein DUF6941
MRVDFAFLCDAATEAGGKLNALGIGIDRLLVRELPQTHRRLVVVTRVSFQAEDAGEQSFAIELIGPDGSNVAPMVQGQLNVQLTEGAGGTRANMIIEIANAQFKSVGPHEAKLSIGGGEVAVLPLEVVLQPVGQ